MLVCCSVGMCWCAVVLKCVEMCVGVLECWCLGSLGDLGSLRELGSLVTSRNPKYSLML